MWSQALWVWMHQTLQKINRALFVDEDAKIAAGQGLVEYALLLTLVGVAAVAVMVIVGPAVANMFQNILDNVNIASGANGG